MQLLFVEVVHFLGSDYLVIVQVYHFEPIVEWLHCAFVFLAKHKVNKVFVAHFTWLLGFELSRHLIKNAIDCFTAQRVPFVSAEIFLVYYKVVIWVKFPKAAVKNIKVLVAKELPNFVYIVFFRHSVQNTEKIRVFEVSVGYVAVIVHIKREKYAHYYGISIPVLKFWCSLQKLETWMCVKQVFKQGLKVFVP